MEIGLKQQRTRMLNPRSFGYRIIILRRALSWTQDFADRMLNAGNGVVRQHEAGRRQWPRLRLLRRLQYLESIYDEEIKAYHAIAHTDRRRRIRCQNVKSDRSANLSTLERITVIYSFGALQQRSTLSSQIARIKEASSFTSEDSSPIDSARRGYADNPKK